MQALTVFTLGYGNRGFDGFIEIVKGLGITHLVDVRSQPYSKYWTDFRREELERKIPEIGLRYVYLGDLLGAQAEADARERGLKRIESASRKAQIGLFCGCQSPQTCHRFSVLAPGLLELGVSVIHVTKDGNVARHEDLVDALVPLQASLF